MPALAEGAAAATAEKKYGEVKQVKDNTVRVQIDDHTRIELAKSSISTIVQKANAPAEVEVK